MTTEVPTRKNPRPVVGYCACGAEATSSFEVMGNREPICRRCFLNLIKER